MYGGRGGMWPPLLHIIITALVKTDEWHSVRERNYSVWKIPNLSFLCIFSVVTDDWCLCNCNTSAHLVRIWRRSQNSTCQFLSHHQVTWMTDPLSPMCSHIQHMVTITFLGASFQSPPLINLFWWKGTVVLWSQMASGLLIGPFRALQSMGVLVDDMPKWICTSIMCLLSC